MYSVYLDLTQGHDLILVTLAALVCVLGAFLSAALSRRMLHATGPRKRVQAVLVSLLMGTTIWSTHFIAMLAYDPGYDHAYEPLMTGLSLGIAVLGVGLANLLMVVRPNGALYPLAGAVFGATVSAMHYAGMSAFLVPGEISWNPGPLYASVVLGVVLGVLAFHRLARPITRVCWLGGAVLLVLSICAMHFTGMTAIEVSLSPLITVPEKVISDALMSLLVLVITGVIFLAGLAAVLIEMSIEGETRKLLNHAARHDALTGLPNRVSLNHHLDKMTAAMARDETLQVAVLTLDLNLFKEVNDVHGHAAGDAVLRVFGARLADQLGPSEFLARTGGDEFMAVKSDFRRRDEVVAFAERLRAVLIEPIDIGNNTSLIVGTSIGIATTLEDGRDLFDLQGKSDVAMYRAKSDPDRDIGQYCVELDHENRERQQLVSDLRLAGSRGEFSLVFQRQNELGKLEVVGFEVLLRWDHPSRGRVSPGVFIPLAEETGLIRDIGLWVLRAACEEAVTWQRPYAIAVNVAPQQLVQPSFVEHVKAILQETGLAPGRLELEVTEASIIDDQTNTLRVMAQLKEMGVRIAMDDFGTGYSSLATLQAFPFDKIKIDRAFIQNVHDDKQRAAIVRATLLLGAALDIPVLAEGVEDLDELNFLQRENCDAVQGFYFGEPLEQHELTEAMVEPSRKSA